MTRHVVLFVIARAVRECIICVVLVFFQAEDGIRDLVRSRGLGDVYKRQLFDRSNFRVWTSAECRYKLCGMTVAPMIPMAI